MSQPSLSGLGDRDESTPPISPFIASEGTSGTAIKPKTNLYTQKSSQSTNRKYQDSSLEADDTESELVAIPESDLSESTLHNSAPGSFDDGVQFEEMTQPLKNDQLKNKVTTANLATAQVALTTISLAEKSEEKPEGKKTSRLFMKLNSLDKIHDKSWQKAHSSSSSDSSRIVTKCSVQEGVRMMVTPSIFMPPQAPVDKVALNQSINVQKTVVITQDAKSESDNESKIKSKDSKEETDGNKTSDSAVSSTISESEASTAKIAISKVNGKYN